MTADLERLWALIPENERWIAEQTLALTTPDGWRIARSETNGHCYECRGETTVALGLYRVDDEWEARWNIWGDAVTWAYRGEWTHDRYGPYRDPQHAVDQLVLPLADQLADIGDGEIRKLGAHVWVRPPGALVAQRAATIVSAEHISVDGKVTLSLRDRIRYVDRDRDLYWEGFYHEGRWRPYDLEARCNLDSRFGTILTQPLAPDDERLEL